MTKLKKVRATGLHAYKSLFWAKFMASRLRTRNHCAYWVLYENGCIIVLNEAEAKRLNKYMDKSINVRKLNAMASYVARWYPLK